MDINVFNAELSVESVNLSTSLLTLRHHNSLNLFDFQSLFQHLIDLRYFYFRTSAAEGRCGPGGQGREVGRPPPVEN